MLEKVAISNGVSDAEFSNIYLSYRIKTIDLANQSGLFKYPKDVINYFQGRLGDKISDTHFVFDNDFIEFHTSATRLVLLSAVQVVPDTSDITLIGIPKIEPSTRSADNDISVCLDIALQTIGIFDGKLLIEEMLKDDNIQAALKNMLPALQTEDWEKFAKLCEKFFKLMIASSAVKKYTEIVGKRIAFRLTLRCVPITGWIYLIASFIVATKSNYKRFSFAK